MNLADSLVIGEFRRVYDDRYRIALPPECIEPLVGESEDAVLAKEREGCLSLWNAELWKMKVDAGVDVIKQKLRMPDNKIDLATLQRFCRLFSTASRPVKLGQRSRLLVPEGFREFLKVEPNNEVIIVGAGPCLEIWNPQVWTEFLRQDISEFNRLFKELI